MIAVGMKVSAAHYKNAPLGSGAMADSRAFQGPFCKVLMAGTRGVKWAAGRQIFDNPPLGFGLNRFGHFHHGEV